jgi:penicillin-binding protein 2
VGDRARRLTILRVLVLSMVLTLLCRLYYVQILESDKPIQTANSRYNASIVVPAARGQILDSQGRVLVGNKVTQVVTVDRATVEGQPDGGASVLAALGNLLGQTAKELKGEITPCGVSVPAPCWTGQPYQPVPVATDASASTVLTISERREDFPGVAISTQTVRTYPSGSLAAQEMGYVTSVGADDIKADPALVDSDTIGASGLEQQYDSVLRGTDGSQDVQLDALGNVVANGPLDPARQGDSLVTSLDANVQSLAENALAAQVAAQRKKGNAAPGGAVVVMDPQTGRVLALASYPTFDLSMFSGGISSADYASLTADGSGDPLVSRAVAGQYAPGSTFKLVSASSDVMNGEASLTSTYACPGSLNVGGITKTNFDSEAYSALTLQGALAVSCDTWFYGFAAKEFSADEARIEAGEQPNEYLQAMAKQFGFASSPGIDLPDGEQASGTIAGRATRQADWDANKAQYCADAASGYTDEPDPTRRAYLTQLAAENCTDGWRYRMSDNADLAIGQGETTVSPLQLAVAYSALVNGGTIWNPTIGWAIVDRGGKVVKTIDPTVKNKVPVSADVLSYIEQSLVFTNGHQVSGALAFDGSPTKSFVAGKTGTAEVYGKADTSWLVSWAPDTTATSAKFVVVGMVEQSGTGSSAAAPMVRQIMEGLYGVNQAPAVPGSAPVTTLPVVAADPSTTRAGSTSGSSKAPTAPVPATPSAVASSPSGSKTSRRRSIGKRPK